MPLLEESLACRARACVHALAAALEMGSAGISDPTYGGGNAGVALFYGYLAAVERSERSAELAWQSLERAINEAAERSLSTSFFSGLTGIAWTGQHLEELLTGEAPDEMNNELDTVLLDIVRQTPWPWPYDLLDGLVGLGCYAVDHPRRAFAEEMLEQIVCRLEELAVPQDGGLTWWTPPAWMAREPGWYRPMLLVNPPGS